MGHHFASLREFLFAMFTLRRLLPVLVILLGCMAGNPLAGQMQAYAKWEDEILPIVTVSNNYLDVLKDGKKRQTSDMACHIRSGPSFAEGFVEVKNIRVDLDPLRDATIKARTDPGAIRFHYQAELVADRSMSDCYALLSFITEGSVGTKLISIGRLGAGNARSIEVKLPTPVDSVGSLHVFTKALEVRSSQHAEAYDVQAYYAQLVKGVHALSATELLKAEDVYEHKLSADGNLLVALRIQEAKKVLIVYDLKSMKLLCEVPITDADRSVYDLYWISDHEVAYIADTEQIKYRSEYNLYLLDARTGKTRELTKDISRIIASLYDKPDVLILYYGWATEKFNVRDGTKSDLQRLDNGAGAGYLLFDRNGNSRLTVRYDGDRINYAFRPTPEGRWREIDDAVKQPGLHFNIRGPQLLDRVVDVHSVGPDGDTLYVSTRLGGADRFELAAFSMSEGVLKHAIAKHPKYDLTTGDGGIARLLFAKKSTQLLGIIYEGQKPQVVWLDPVYAAVQKSMDATFPDHVNLPVDWCADHSTFIFFSSSDQDPGTYYVYKPRESRLIPILELGERLKGRTLAKTEPFEFTSRDGQKIPAYLTRPLTPANGPAPLIVSIHGGPMARDSWGYNPENQFFASRGYMVLQVNYRGSSGYGAAFQNAGLRARLDTVIIDDIADGVRYLIDRKEVDPSRVAAMGASFGGWATYMSLIKYPAIYRAGIAISAVSNWRKAMNDDRWSFDNKLAYTFWKSLLGRDNFKEDEKFIDPVLRAGEIKQPVFIIHGERDTTVSSNEAKLMVDALKKQNPNVQARSFPEATHTEWSFDDRVARLNEIALFLNRYLGKSEKAP
jgi:dipeptidyl aminopeptidase/acylaminoacyl peptidase